MSPRHRGRRHGGGHAAGQNGAIPNGTNGVLDETASVVDAPRAPRAPRPPANGAAPSGANGNGGDGAANGNGSISGRPGPGRNRLGGPSQSRPPRPAPRAAAVAVAVAESPDDDAERSEENSGEPAYDEQPPGERKPACTLAQMRRFIKSRPYVPVHELRRRFEIEGLEDEVSPMPTAEGMLFVGLPYAEAGYLAELVKAGDVGYELLLDPSGPAVVGVFPMRPVARQ